MTLRMIDTFSGIGGFSLAARWLGGIETVQFVERDPYCQQGTASTNRIKAEKACTTAMDKMTAFQAAL